jgi:hypothetical protein
MLKRRTSEQRGAKVGPGRSQLLIQAFQTSNKLSLSKPGKSLQGTGTQRLLLACQALAAGGGRTAGKLEAKSRQEALAHLNKLRLRPLKLQEEGSIVAAGGEGTGGFAVEQPMSEAQIISFIESETSIILELVLSLITL